MFAKPEEKKLKVVIFLVFFWIGTRTRICMSVFKVLCLRYLCVNVEGVRFGIRTRNRGV